jgi:hypothetical protein
MFAARRRKRRTSASFKSLETPSDSTGSEGGEMSKKKWTVGAIAGTGTTAGLFLLAVKKLLGSKWTEEYFPIDGHSYDGGPAARR